VLVDSSHPDQFKRLPPDPPGTDAKWIQEAEFVELTAPIGIPRLLGYCGDSAALRAAECRFDSARENASGAVHFARVLSKPAGQAISEIFRS
jgi:hypothetical protein